MGRKTCLLVITMAFNKIFQLAYLMALSFDLFTNVALLGNVKIFFFGDLYIVLACYESA